MFYRDFFVIDDAKNMFLPLFGAMGRIWLNFEIPLLTDRTFLGGNFLVDMAAAPFAPQVIVTSVVAASFDDWRKAVAVFAVLNIWLAWMGAYALARSLKVDHGLALSVAFSAASGPMFNYVMLGSWWNSAAGFPWLLLGTAALIRLAENGTRGNFVAAVGAAVFLFQSAATQMQLLYMFSAAGLGFIEYRRAENPGAITRVVAVLACAGLLSLIPIASEYVANISLTDRSSSFSNDSRSIAPSWGHVVNFFNPFYGDYIGWFRGYLHVPLSLGYAGVFTLVLIFFGRFDRHWTRERCILLTMAVIAFVLSFSAAQVGPTRFPLRYLPFLTVLICIIPCAFFDRSELRNGSGRREALIGFALAAGLLQFWSAQKDLFEITHLFSVLFFLAAIVAILAGVRHEGIRRNPALFCLMLSMSAFVLQHMRTPQIIPLFENPPLPERVSAIDPPECFVLRTGGTAGHGGMELQDQLAARGLLFGARSVNGYSPVSHRDFARLLPHETAHGNFTTSSALTNVFARVPEAGGARMFELLNICRISLPVWDAPPMLAEMAEGVALRREQRGLTVILSRDDFVPRGTLSHPLTNGVAFVSSDGPRRETFAVQASDEARTLFFSRLYWKGYAATLDGRPLVVDAHEGVLVRVAVPAGASGTLELTYTPVTLPLIKTSLVLGLLFFAFYLRRLPSRRAEAPFVAAAV